MAQAQSKNFLKKSHTILICDDENDIVNLAEKILIWAGYNTITCTNGQDLLKAMKKMYKKIDLILLDVRMPIMNGHETLKVLKTTNDYKNIPVILFTVSIYNKDVQRGRELGADAFLPKPFSAKRLISYIQDILNVN